MSNGKHWSDEQLIDHLYAVGPADRHLSGCEECERRLTAMRASRQEIEACYRAGDALNQEWLAAQRRGIYQQLDRQAARPWWASPARGWASAALAVVLVSGGLAVYRDPQLLQSRTAVQHPDQPKVSDAVLAEQVSQIADNPEPSPVAPLQALFED